MSGQREITVARVAKLFGPQGQLTLNLLEDFPKNFDMSEPLFVLLDGLAVPLFLEHFQRRGQRGATALFADIDTERRASELVGRELFIRSGGTSAADEEAPDGEIYIEDLAGFDALLGSGLRGRIEEFVDGENPLLRLTVDGKEAWIPAVEEMIAGIDTEARTVEFDLPEGLLELYLE